MKVVIAPDKFKGCLTAAEVAEAVAAGLRSARPDVELVSLPVADGGDGTVAAALSAGYDAVEVDALGPTGEPGRIRYAVRGDRAVIELAGVVGLDRLPGQVFQPLTASTYGLGQVVADAIGRGVRETVLGLGGSASTDGGAGLAQALGARLLDADGNDLAPGGAALTALDRLDLGPLREFVAGVRVTIASDVDNPLLGPNGAAAVFGPQKGATPQQVAQLEAGLAHWAAMVGGEHATTPGAGAAGGTGFGALALLGATIRPGIDLVLELIGFADRIDGADLVITGEGSLDEQSLAGKAPVGVARAAARTGAPVVAVAGRCLLTADRLRDAGMAAAYPLSDLEPDVGRSMAEAASLLTRVGNTIAKEWLP